MRYRIFICLASIVNAVMDVIDHSFSASIFKHLPEKFWKKDVSWLYAEQFLGYKFDAWHIAKSIMVILIAFAVVTFKNKYTNKALLRHMIWIALIWNITFELAYWLLKIK